MTEPRLAAPGGVGRLVGAAALTFLLAILAARLLLTATPWAWVGFLLLLPILFLALALAVGRAAAGFFVAFGAGAVLVLRAFLLGSELGWTGLLLLPVLLLTFFLVARVLGALRDGMAKPSSRGSAAEKIEGEGEEE